MQDLEVRSPTPSAGKGPDLMAQVLARAKSGQAGAGQPPKPDAAAPRPAAPAAPKLDSLPEIQARTPPGPQAKAPAAAPPLKGPGPAKPPAYVAAAAAAAAKSAQLKAAAAAKPAPVAPTAATPPAAAMAPAGPPSAAALIDMNAPWLPDEPERKTAFLQVYRYWHAQVRPEFAHKAKPSFLFLVTALPVMVKARDTLVGLDLWEPHGEQSRQKRDQHPSWKKYCEFMPRAQQALLELDDYRHLSLLTALDDLNSRIIKAEKKFREGLPQPAKGRR